MADKLDRWQIAIILLCTVLIVGGVMGLLSVQLGKKGAVTNPLSTLEDYLENEQQVVIPDGVISKEEVRAIALETLPEKGEPTEIIFEVDEWEAKYNDGSEIKIDAVTGEILEIEEE